jgi:hypothetical protein
VLTSVFTVISRIVGNLVTKFLTSIARIRTAARAMSTTPIILATRINRCARRGAGIAGCCGIGWRSGFVRLVIPGRVGQIIRGVVVCLTPSFGFGRRNLTNDLVWFDCVRIQDFHRDLQVVTTGGWHVGQHRRNTECKYPGQDQLPRWHNGLTTAHAKPSYSESL